jgi:hypothetical protein
MTKSIQLGQAESALDHRAHKIADRIARLYAPRTLVLIAVDHWFGSRWLNFSGKILGIAGVHSYPPSIPPFVPARIVSQRRFASPNYVETDAGRPLHIEVSSSEALRRKLATIEPDTAVIWYSADSYQTGQMSLMTYAPVNGEYLNWYASFQRHGND